MAIEIKIPDLGDGVESGDVLEVFVSPGDSVDKGQDLVELETDKATVTVPSTASGTVAEILVSEGDTVSVGGIIVKLEGAAADSAPASAPAAQEPAPAEPAPAPAPVARDAASPRSSAGANTTAHGPRACRCPSTCSRTYTGRRRVDINRSRYRGRPGNSSIGPRSRDRSQYGDRKR